MMHSKTDKTLKNERTSWISCTEWCGSKTREGVRSGVGRRELKNRGRGMKGRVDKSMGIVTLIDESLDKINPTESSRFTKCVPSKILASRCVCKKIRRTKSSRRDPKCSRWPIEIWLGHPICVELTIMSYLYSDHIVQNTIRLRSSSGGHSVCEWSVCNLSGTSISVMSQCDIGLCN